MNSNNFIEIKINMEHVFLNPCPPTHPPLLPSPPLIQIPGGPLPRPFSSTFSLGFDKVGTPNKGLGASLRRDLENPKTVKTQQEAARRAC